ncbi:YqzL family protein [Paenibacillus eucommiae]|uniref:YqzL family protein n=1 Tax=Paenibacillus eucommiae TaxID=1355755 RepID=A0ABS4IZ22_9BACL|nr:YqzL family protein [Paenibacillus eucommiae]MBP1992843.1 hypothetical protein [Paenibacillus eucommiae]
MKDFSWQYFSISGDLDAYLLYKQVEGGNQADSDGREEQQGIEDPPGGLNG